MDKCYNEYKGDAHVRISEIENFEYVDENGYHELFRNILIVLLYIYNIGKHGIIDLKEEEDIKKIPGIIEKQYKFFEEYMIRCGRGRENAYKVLCMRSALCFLKENFADRGEDFVRKIEKLDSYLVKMGEGWEDMVYVHYLNEEIKDTEYYAHGPYYDDAKDLVEEKGVPETHIWWPSFCRQEYESE
ncbi:hypothetical protein SLOPH_1152 [Spraguea lophii 42_110]|uniref:Uncharacterized protein n=1 Tax=Spraguea lophii (strain 42_110) TaxID=1358809 RepID=S7W6K7_SPRLO|nr:hypothetical protein SLOPH_1152 [Spraguea lophii 42_110]